MIEFNDNFDNVENENIGGSSTLSEGSAVGSSTCCATISGSGPPDS